MKLWEEHEKLDSELKKEYAKLTKNGKPSKFFFNMSMEFRVSDETIRNYVKGKGYDGLLKKRLIEKIKKLQKVKCLRN